MAGSEEYRGRARQCENLAESTLHPESREILLKLAARWRVLAEADEWRLRPQSASAVPETAREPA